RIHPEPASVVVVRKPKTVGKRCLPSTHYRAYTGPLPDPDIVASGEKLCQLDNNNAFKYSASSCLNH
ncbi:hypothetical protein XENORESO_020048, partial [Xenotaenia resolanae]